VSFNVADYASSKLEGVRIGAGGEINATCPFCGKSGGFYINPKTGAYICHKLHCDQRGRTIVGLIAHVEGISRAEAYGWLFKESVRWSRREETPETLLDKIRELRDIEGDEEDELVEAPLPVGFKSVWDAKKGCWRYPSYLKQRGIKKKTAKEWGIGYCDKGRFGGRIIIPIDCPNGHSFTARDATGEQQPKYLNPTGVDHGRLLLGWNQCELDGDVVLVEGPLDVITMWQHGISSMALLGKVLHPAQLAMLFKKPLDSAITVLLDPDQPAAPYDVAKQLTCRFDHVYVARLPDGVDPGESTLEQAKKAVSNAKKYKGERNPALMARLESVQKKLENMYG